ncbi:MAG: hypothetical protein K2Q34_01175 [Alphaproteobacteria bacterium]|nr:hypothetical protein [Alphaproteobacteria bacterium]
MMHLIVASGASDDPDFAAAGKEKGQAIAKVWLQDNWRTFIGYAPREIKRFICMIQDEYEEREKGLSSQFASDDVYNVVLDVVYKSHSEILKNMRLAEKEIEQNIVEIWRKHLGDLAMVEGVSIACEAPQPSPSEYFSPKAVEALEAERVLTIQANSPAALAAKDWIKVKWVYWTSFAPLQIQKLLQRIRDEFKDHESSISMSSCHPLAQTIVTSSLSKIHLEILQALEAVEKKANLAMDIIWQSNLDLLTTAS